MRRVHWKVGNRIITTNRSLKMKFWIGKLFVWKTLQTKFKVKSKLGSQKNFICVQIQDLLRWHQTVKHDNVGHVLLNSIKKLLKLYFIDRVLRLNNIINHTNNTKYSYTIASIQTYLILILAQPILINIRLHNFILRFNFTSVGLLNNNGFRENVVVSSKTKLQVRNLFLSTLTGLGE